MIFGIICLVSRDIRKLLRVKSEINWSHTKASGDAEYTEVYVKYTEFYCNFFQIPKSRDFNKISEILYKISKELRTPRKSSTWEWQTTSLITFIFGMLVNVGKKILCLQCRFISWRESRDIDCSYDVILRKPFARVKDTQ